MQISLIRFYADKTELNINSESGVKILKNNILIIVNPCSGKKRGRKSTDDIIHFLSDDSINITVKETACKGHAAQLAEQLGCEYDLIICCGGDGTFNEIINGVLCLDKKIPLAYIPNGTTNDTAKTLSLPAKLPDLAEIIKGGKYNKCDIGLFNNRYFFCAVTFGFGAEASFTTKQSLKNKIGHFAYILSNIRKITDVHSVKMTVECDNQKITGEFIFGAVINTKSVGGIFKLDENVFRINDGKFEIVLVRKLCSIIEIPDVLVKLQKQEYDDKQIILIQASRIKFTSPEKVSWLIDGENGGKLKEVNVDNIQQGIEICAPESNIFI